MIFNFVVRHLHFLAKVPLAAQFFDAALLTWTAIFDRERLRAIEELEQKISNLPNVDLCVHRFGGTGFVLGGQEFGHVHGNGLVDIELTRSLAKQLIGKKRARPHHVLGPSRWVSVWVASRAEVPSVFALIQLASENVAIKKAGSKAGLPTFAEAPV